VLNENRRDPHSDTGFVDLCLDFVGNFVGAFAVGPHVEFFLLHTHGEN